MLSHLRGDQLSTRPRERRAGIIAGNGSVSVLGMQRRVRGSQGVARGRQRRTAHVIGPERPDASVKGHDRGRVDCGPESAWSFDLRAVPGGRRLRRL